MSTTPKPISVADAISPVTPPEAAEDVLEWQMRKLKERQKAADEGRFASAEAVRSVIRKFIPNG
jgi:hypothetical protein